jgi:hypothetical protein
VPASNAKTNRVFKWSVLGNESMTRLAVIELLLNVIFAIQFDIPVKRKKEASAIRHALLAFASLLTHG